MGTLIVSKYGVGNDTNINKILCHPTKRVTDGDKNLYSMSCRDIYFLNFFLDGQRWVPESKLNPKFADNMYCSI